MALAVTTATSPTLQGVSGVSNPGTITSVGGLGAKQTPINEVLGASTTTSNTPGTAATPSNTGTYVSQAQDALTTALNALKASNTAVTGTNGLQQQGENQLASTEAANKNTYDNTIQSDAQNLTNAETAANTQGNTDITSLDRMIAAMGGGGSSIETQEVPQLVDRSVEGNIGNANMTAATNDRAANVAWNTFLNQLGSQKSQLTDQVNTQLATNQASYNKSAQLLKAIIAQIQANPTDTSDAQYELDSAISGIPNVVSTTPTFTGTTPVYATPALSNFTLTPSSIAAAAGTAAPVSGAAVIPWLAANQKQTSNAT